MPVPPPEIPPPPPVVRWLGRIPYVRGLALQEDLAAKRKAGTIPDTILLLEHDPVFTIGRTRDRESLGEGEALPHPSVTTNRGGQATYHGPGQLVGYLIIDLRRCGADLHRYLRALERALVDALSDCGVTAGTREGLTGVWVGERKIASIGVGVRHWVSMHGFALNVLPDSLPPFASITPCGIEGVRMTCLADESTAGSAAPNSVIAAARRVVPRLTQAVESLRAGSRT